MGLLDGQIADAIYAGFKGKLKTGVLRKVVIGQSAGLDDKGDPIDVAPVDYPFEGFTSQYKADFMARAGIPDTDLKVSIFAKSLDAGIAPANDDKAYIDGVWYQIRKKAIDPAGAMWICQSFEIADQGEI